MRDNPGASRASDNDPLWRPGHDRSADDWHRDGGPAISAHRGGSLGEDLTRLSEGDERDLHFNGYPPHNLQPLHELCAPGGCRYKSQAENCADLDAWFRVQNHEPDQRDPEAEP